MKIGFQVKIGGESAKYTLPPPSQSQRFKFLQQVVDALPDLRIAQAQIFHVLGVEISGAVAAAGDLVHIAGNGAQELHHLLL